MDPLFEVHILNDNGIAKARALAAAFDALLQRLRELAPESSREFSICKTHLETAAFFAKKAIACFPENQVEDRKAASA